MSEYYEPEKVLQKLHGLSNTERNKLQIIAHKLATNHAHISSTSLLNQAICDTVSGVRNWPKNLQFDVYFGQAMRSIRSNINEKLKRTKPYSPDDQVFETPSTGTLNPEEALCQKQNEQEREQKAKMVMEGIRKTLIGDALAQAVFDYQLSDRQLTKGDFIKKKGCSNTQYESAQKKVRRAINKAISNAGKA